MLNNGTTPVLPEENMRALGFTDHVKEHWYLAKHVGVGITLNITIDKSSGIYEEYVLDVDYGQPYYYAEYDTPFAHNVRKQVDIEIQALNEAGIKVAVDHNLYKMNKGDSGSFEPAWTTDVFDVAKVSLEEKELRKNKIKALDLINHHLCGFKDYLCIGFSAFNLYNMKSSGNNDPRNNYNRNEDSDYL